MVSRIKRSLKQAWAKLKLREVRRWALKVEGGHIKSIVLQKLTSGEMNQLKEQWGRLGLSIYPDFYEMYKSIDKFNVQYLSDDIYYPYILKVLNPQEYSVAFSHKGYYDIHFKGVHMPKTFLKSINGVYYNESYKPVSKERALAICREINDDFIIKPTIDTSTGKNVEKADASSDLEALFQKMGADFVVQELVKQSSQTSRFNPNSLNTFRITSLYLNGKVHIASIVFRFGRPGSHVDNLGAGGIIIGVKEDGQFYEFGYDNKYNKYYSSGEYTFKDIVIPEVKQLVDFVLQNHPKYLPNMGIVGWDLALDGNNAPILIEVNLKYPGIQFEQLCVAKPLFGNRTDEVIDYVIKAHSKK